MKKLKKPSYKQFIGDITKNLQKRKDVTIKKCGLLKYKLQNKLYAYPYYSLQSNPISKKDNIVLIRACIHGDEVFGPRALMKYIGKIFDYAHGQGVKLIIFPLDNPSGFERGQRYNIESDHGDAGNNDFLRYILPNGKMVDDIKTGRPFRDWKWSSDSCLKLKLPKETVMLHRELQKISLKQIKGVLDLHADNFISRPYTYQYIFGRVKDYTPIIKKISKLAPVLANTYVDSGYVNDPGYTPERIENGKIVKDAAGLKSDIYGCIVRHDGSLTDLLYRLGTPYCVAPEVTIGVRQTVADKINLLWIKGIIDLVARIKKHP